MSQVTPVLEAPRRAAPWKAVPAPLATAAAVTALAHLPLLLAQGRQLWLRPHYQLFPLVLAGAVVLAAPAWRLVAAGAVAGPVARRVGVALLGLNWLLLAAALVLESPWLGSVAFWELLAAVAVLAGGWPVFRAAPPVLAYLLLIIPPPMSLDVRLVNSLQTWTSKCSNRVLDYVGVLHTLSGNVVEVAGKSYFVEEACSGIHSLLSILAVTLFYVFWARCHWLRAILLVFAAVFWVVTANVLRIVAIVFVDTRWGIDLSQGFLHLAFGFVLFGLTLSLLASTDRFLLFLGTAVRWGHARHDAAPAAAPPAEPAARPRLGWAAVTPAVAAYAVLVLFQVGDLGLGGGVSESSLVAYYNGFQHGDLPERVGPWVRQPADTFDIRDRENPLDPFGAHSRVWRYQKDGGLTALVSLDYPFPGWHDLRNCYQGTGWTLGTSEAFDHRLPDGGDQACLRFAMVNSMVRHGYVWFAEFDQGGRPVDAESWATVRGYLGTRLSERAASLRDRWLALFSRRPAPPHYYDILQVQTLVENYGPLTEADQEQTKQLFTAGLDALRAKCLAGLAGPSGP
jgi:exosortase